jgi:hypothetical protein
MRSIGVLKNGGLKAAYAIRACMRVWLSRGGIDQGIFLSLVVFMERVVRRMVLSSRWLLAAPDRSRGQGWPQATAGGGA